MCDYRLPLDELESEERSIAVEEQITSRDDEDMRDVAELGALRSRVRTAMSDVACVILREAREGRLSMAADEVVVWANS